MYYIQINSDTGNNMETLTEIMNEIEATKAKLADLEKKRRAELSRLCKSVTIEQNGSNYMLKYNDTVYKVVMKEDGNYCRKYYTLYRGNKKIKEYIAGEDLSNIRVDIARNFIDDRYW